MRSVVAVAVIAAIIVVVVALRMWYVQNLGISPAQMSLGQAVTLARQAGTECSQKGTVSGTGTYNPSSDTWWLDFTPNARYVQQGCNPACVVSAASSTAEINWRCTGLIQPASKDDLITLDAPLPNAMIASPLAIHGSARGNWYFEGSFPVKLVDALGTVIAQGQARAQGEWTTTDYVPFSATLTFTSPGGGSGTLVLEKDNPSGLPQNANELDVPVSFSPSR